MAAAGAPAAQPLELPANLVRIEQLINATLTKMEDGMTAGQQNLLRSVWDVRLLELQAAASETPALALLPQFNNLLVRVERLVDGLAPLDALRYLRGGCGPPTTGNAGGFYTRQTVGMQTLAESYLLWRATELEADCAFKVLVPVSRRSRTRLRRC